MISTTTVLLTVLLSILITVDTVCPPQCICADNSIVCSCENTASSELFIASLGSSYISSLTVHSCSKVSLANDSFSGVILADRLSLISISRLVIEPHAFRGILQAPRQIVIDRCFLPVILPYAFTGLSHLDHIWFRNSSITSIHTHAFHSLTNVGYLYFRDVKIRNIQYNAFGEMRGVQHVYLRGNIEIESVEGSQYANSTIDEIVWDEVRAQVDEGFMAGVSVHDVSIVNSLLKVSSLGDSHQRNDKPMGQLKISNVTWNSFVPFLLTDFEQITVQRSKIGKIRGNDERGNGKMKLSFDNVFIESIEPYSLSSSKISNITFTNCLLLKIDKGAFSRSSGGVIVFKESQIRRIVDSAFADSDMEMVVFEKSTIEEIESLIISNSHINRFLFHHSRINRFHPNGLANGKIDKLIFEHTTMTNIGNDILNNSVISSLRIHNCDIGSDIRQSILSTIRPPKLSITNNKLQCDVSDCEMNSLLLKPPIHDLLWKFGGNTCRNKEYGVCVTPTTLSSGTLACRSSWLVAECLCEGPTGKIPYDINATVLILGDCEEVVVSGGSPSIRALYLYRIDALSIATVPRNLKTLEVFHSGLFLKENAIHNQNVAMISVKDSRIEEIERNSITSSTIAELKLDRSTVGPILDLSIVNSTVLRLSANHCQLENTGSLFRQVKHLSLANSILGTAPAMTSVDHLHLQNNTVLCCCQQPSECGNSMDIEETQQRCERNFPDYQCRETNSNRGMKGLSIVITMLFIYFTYQMETENI